MASVIMLNLRSSRITALLGHISTLTRVSRDEKGQAESFVDESERIVLVGEAAHPLGVRMPYIPVSLRLQDLHLHLEMY